MAVFFMFGKYSSEAIKGIGAKRTEKAVEIIKKLGGEVKSMYALLAEQDVILIVSLPGVEEAMKASVALAKLTGIAFTTAPAVSVEEFDKMMG
jgi:uncharacterized protein with GYD domain